MSDPNERREEYREWRTAMEKQIAENTAMTAETKSKVDDVFDILVAARGAIKVLNALASVAKWAGIIAGAGTAIYVVWHQITHGGQLPK
jgi:hypothetical protein